MDFKPAHRLRGPAGQRLASCSSGARISRSSNRVSPNAAAESPQQQRASSSLSREAGCSQRHQEDQQQHHQHAVATAAAASAASLLSLLSGAGAALAEEPAYNYPAQDDPVITVMFTVAIGLLSIVTLGVIYLAVLSWFDSRQEQADQTGSPFTKKMAADKAEEERQEEKRRVRRNVDKSKGFGQ